jgi:hypothetical protein
MRRIALKKYFTGPQAFDYLVAIVIDGKIIVKLVLRKMDVRMWAGFIALG